MSDSLYDNVTMKNVKEQFWNGGTRIPLKKRKKKKKFIIKQNKYTKPQRIIATVERDILKNNLH